VDWEERDARLAAKIEATAQQLKNRAEKPFWVSRNALKKAVGEYDRIHNVPDKLPRTLKALETCAETQEDFAVRRMVVGRPVSTGRAAAWAVSTRTTG
jgi:hypothetical protein